MKEVTTRASKQPRFFLPIAIGLFYGLFVRLTYHWPHLFSPAAGPKVSGIFFPNDLWVMTFGFLIVAPYVMGWLSISTTERDGSYHWLHWIFAPWVTVLLSNACLLVAGLEGMICVIFALPITLIMGSLGGIASGLSGRSKALSARSTSLCLAVLPFCLSFLEMQLNAPLQIRTVQTSILIHAPAATVWKNVARVPAINPAELEPTWTHRIGFPLPVEATLDHEGIGGIRHASFEGGLLFIETVNEWEPLRKLGFSIAADTAHIPLTTLDEHVTIGGRFFDVLDGEYRLEPLSNGDILLHLSSRERLSTDFNTYAALWSDAVMRDLQVSILQVVKHRCEAPSAVPLS